MPRHNREAQLSNRKVIYHLSGYSLAENPDWEATNREGRQLSPKYADWGKVCWGENGRMGRIPMFLSEAFIENADLMVWSTGATRLKTGQSEAHVHMMIALASFNRFEQDFPHRFRPGLWYPRREQSESSYRSWLRNRSLPEASSRNTSDSMDILVGILRERYERDTPLVLRLVSSNNHAKRVHRDALVAFGYKKGGKPYFDCLTISAVSAETGYAHKEPDETVVRDLGD